jgi:hypothetical protein
MTSLVNLSCANESYIQFNGARKGKCASSKYAQHSSWRISASLMILDLRYGVDVYCKQTLNLV